MKIDMKLLKEEQLEILTLFDEYCKKNQIQYYLAYGTLLGAVRHKGYIPWDDDIDVMMFRKDYDFLVDHNIIAEGIQFTSLENDPKFPYPFAKIINTKTILREKADFNYPDFGINIDVFPLDYFPNEYSKRKRKLRRIKRLKFICDIKAISYSKDRSLFKNIIVNILKWMLVFVPRQTIMKKIVKLSRKDKLSNYCGINVWGYGEKEVFKCSTFDGTTTLEFEGKQYQSPEKYHEILTQLYGDYMTLPPEEKRVSHHEFDAYYKGEE